MTTSDLDRKVAELRGSFDHAFALAPEPPVRGLESLVAIRIAGDPYALRVRDLAGLVASRKIVHVPSRRTELLGIAGIRGSLVPVYSLAALLGYGSRPLPNPWLALCGSPDPIALAFQELEGFLQVRGEDVHGGELVRVGNLARPIVDVMTATEAFKTSKERK